jgi:predicted nucleic acid-binding protein
MLPSVYIETTIPSFHFSNREEPEMIAIRQWTRDWWTQEAGNYEMVTSDAVLEELAAGNHPEKRKKLALVQFLRLLEITSEVVDVAEVYISQKLMPRQSAGDALHLAIASYYKCDYLLTWNCKHIANANKFSHIRRINEKLHLSTPELVTPLELTQEEI